jgi:DNA-binding transcriptional LysR family regulator
VLPIVTAFLADYPQIDVQLVLSDRNADLVADQIDMAVRIGPLHDSSMIAVRVGAVRRVVCASPAFFSIHGTPKYPADLASLACVTFGADASMSWAFAARGRSARSVAVRPRLVVNTAEAAIDAAIAGVGATQVLSYQVASALRERRLKVVLQDFELEPLPVHLVHPAQSHLPLKLRRFLEFTAPRLKKMLAEIEKRVGPSPRFGGEKVASAKARAG